MKAICKYIWVVLIGVFFISIPIFVEAISRCQQFIPEIRKVNLYYRGITYPYWYNIAQAQAESNCRGSITAFDGGMGLYQFMPITSKEINKQLKDTLSPYKVSDAIKMNAYYMYKLHKQNWHGALWLDFAFYNSGFGTIHREFVRAGSKTNYNKMKSICKRKVLTLKNGNKLDLCDVGYDYPQRIYKLANPYKIGKDQINYWND